jgi:hypothetical protein
MIITTLLKLKEEKKGERKERKCKKYASIGELGRRLL